MVRLQPVHVANVRSWWLQQALDLDADPFAPALTGANRADVCIIGGGYTGLWTALRLKELDPSLDVVVLEADTCGSGASGRNGGLVLSWWRKFTTLLDLYGESEAIRLAAASAAAIDDIGQFCVDNGIDAHFRKNGILRTATAPAQMAKMDRVLEACAMRGLPVFQPLSSTEVQQRSGSIVYLSGVFEPHAATVQPALLVRGLRKVARERGIRIYEHSPVKDIDARPVPYVRTDRGGVSATKVILATNAWAADLPELKRAVVVLSSDMVITAPIPARLQEIGWTGGESITDGRLMVHYHQTTRDGRIAIGRGSGGLAYGGKVTEEFNRSQARANTVVKGLHYLYPTLADVPVTHSWSGAVDRTRTDMMVFGEIDHNPAIIYGLGYSGTGIAPSLIGAKVLASLALDRKDEWTESPFNRGAWVEYPSEPVRYFGGRVIKAVVQHKEESEQDGRTAGRLESWLASQANAQLPRQKR